MPSLRGVRLSEGPSSGGARLSRAALGALLVACAGDRIVIGGQLSPTITELVDADAGAERDGGTSAPGVGVRARCPDSPSERRELLGCWPTRHVGRWQGFWLGLPRYETGDGAAAEFPPGDVVMRFDVNGSGTFSVGVLSSAAGACGVALDAGACVPFAQLVGGFAYRLEQVRLQDAGERGTPRVAGEALPRAGELLEFELRLGEPWDASCTDSAPASCQGSLCPAARAHETAATPAEPGVPPLPCRCGAERCVADAPTLSLALTMSEDGQALRGAYRPRDVRLPAVSLELFKAGGP